MWRKSDLSDVGHMMLCETPRPQYWYFISCLCISVTMVPDRNSSREEWLIVVYGIRGFFPSGWREVVERLKPLWLGCVAELIT